MQRTIARFLTLLTGLVCLAAAFSWLSTTTADSDAERLSRETIAEFDAKLEQIRCQNGTAAECAQAINNADKSRAALDEGIQAHQVLTVMAVVGVVMTGAWWWAIRGVHPSA